MHSFRLLTLLVVTNLPGTLLGAVVAFDDFDSTGNLTNYFVATTDGGGGRAFSPFTGNPARIFEITNQAERGTQPMPWLYDDSLSSPDAHGIIKSIKTDSFFGFAGQGGAVATWQFDISSASSLSSIELDLAAMGAFEFGGSGPDELTVTASIDGQPQIALFQGVGLGPGSTFPQTYTLEDGSNVTLNGAFGFNSGTLLLSNDFTTLTSNALSGLSGNQLDVRLEVVSDRRDESFALDNIVINGTIAAVPEPSSAPLLFAWLFAPFLHRRQRN